MSAVNPERPRHARKEIRDFADWMESRGWRFESVDSSGHTIWSHPKVSGTYKLPETPHSFHVRRQRAQVLRAEGVKLTGRNRERANEKRRAHAARERAETEKRRTEREAFVAEKECADLREACKHAGTALRNDPSNPRLRAHFERLRMALAQKQQETA